MPPDELSGAAEAGSALTSSSSSASNRAVWMFYSLNNTRLAAPCGWFNPRPNLLYLQKESLSSVFSTEEIY
jgi:hypothetical protein